MTVCNWNGAVVKLPARILSTLLFMCTAMDFSSSATAGNLARGREIARVHCARCHVVGDFNRMGGISSTPSFFLLVREFDDWRARFETFYARRPHPAFITITGIGRSRSDLPANAHPITLPLSAVADVISYVQTLPKAKKMPKARRTPKANGGRMADSIR